MDVIFVSFLWSARRRGTKSFLTVLQCPSFRIMYLSLVWSSCRKSFFKSRKHASHKAQLECCTQTTFYKHTKDFISRRILSNVFLIKDLLFEASKGRDNGQQMILPVQRRRAHFVMPNGMIQDSHGFHSKFC